MEYVEDMTWREFLLRLSGYNRKIKQDWQHTRFISYYSLVATGAINTKKMSMDKFMPLDDENNKSSLNNDQKELLKNAWEIAIKEAKEKANG